MHRSINTKKITLPLLILLFTSNASASVISNNKNNLVADVTCERSTTPDEFIDTIKAAGGKSIISGNMGMETDSIFMLPTPANVWGYSVSQFSVHRGSNEDGDFNEFTAVMPINDNQTTVDMIAALGKVTKIADNYFLVERGNNDLTVRQYDDTVYVSCANDVRTITKSIQRNIRQLKSRFEN